MATAEGGLAGALHNADEELVAAIRAVLKYSGWAEYPDSLGAITCLNNVRELHALLARRGCEVEQYT